MRIVITSISQNYYNIGVFTFLCNIIHKKTQTENTRIQKKIALEHPKRKGELYQNGALRTKLHYKSQLYGNKNNCSYTITSIIVTMYISVFSLKDKNPCLTGRITLIFKKIYQA